MGDNILTVSGDGPTFVRALYDYQAADGSSLSFRQNDILEILSTLESGWWDGVALSSGTRGWLPSNYVSRVSEEEAQMAVGGLADLRRGSVASLLSSAGGGSDEAQYAAGLVGDVAGMSLSRDPSFTDLMVTADDDLTSFSAGGDIFSEIAAAAQAESTADSNPQPHHAPSSSFTFPSRPAARQTDQQVATGSFPGLPAAAATFGVDGTVEDEDAEFYWVPKMTTGGQLFYYNTRTGETSRDMPIDGKGDGVRIDRTEFSTEDEEAALPVAAAPPPLADGQEGEWSERITADGQSAYYVNLRTGEQTWDPPRGAGPMAGSRRGSLARALSPAGSTWTERAPRPQPIEVVEEERQDGEDLKRASMYSDDSALDMAFAGSARRERRASVDVDATPVKADSGLVGRPVASRRPPPQRKMTSTVDLLGPPPPPLIADLEEIASRSMQELIQAVGLAGVAGGGSRNHAAERDRLAQLGNDVVQSLRLVLQSSGVLEHPVLVSPFSTSASPANEITGPFSHFSPLSHSAQADLRPFSRRLISTLSKLTFSLRAMWGLLETTPEDQLVEEDETPADPEEILRRAQARQQAIVERKAIKEFRFEHETKLRSEVMQGTRDVSDQVLTFLQHFQRVVASVSVSEGQLPIPLNQLRAPKATQGSLRTNAAALLLPGGGFGGNWRGNGYVSLPTPHSSPNASACADHEKLAYAWPSKPISREVGEEIARSSDGLVAEAEQLAITAGADEVDVSAVFERATAVQDQLSAFIAQVEEVDVAAGVDFQLPRGEESRAPSRPDSMAPSTTTTSENTTGEADDDSAARYKASVLKAKPLLAEFEARKQALYDLAPRLVLVLQNALVSSPSSPSFAGQPADNSPLAFLPSPASSPSLDSSVLRNLVDDLATASPSLCTTLTSLVAIAEVQASAPRTLRTYSLAFRTSLFIPPAAPSIPPSSDSGHGHSSSQRMSVTRSSQSQDSTFRSYRSSTDSDFFFSGSVSRNVNGGAGPAASSSTSLNGSGSVGGGTIRSQSSSSGAPASSARGPVPFGSVSNAPNSSAEMLGGGGSAASTGLPPGWDNRRRGSVATTQTSSSAGTANPSLTSVHELPESYSSTLSPSRSSSKNIQKLLGEVPVLEHGIYEPAKPWYLDRDWADDELSFTMENTIKGGTLRGLVIAATSHEGRVDSSYLSAFLMTYRTFCTSSQLLDQLIDRYLVPEPEELDGEQYKEWDSKKLKPIRARVTNFLKAWVREYMDHEDLNPQLLQRIREFALNTMTERGQSLQICKSVDERLQGAAPRTVGNLAPGALPQPILPRNLKKFKLTDLEPLEVARQLTIMDSRLFQRITPQECLSKAWPKEFGNEAPNISAMIDMSNAVTRWVTETILAQEDLKKRANIVKHVVAIAESCLSLNNFSTLIHIIAGLNSTPIHRLRRTWESVNQKAMISLGMLNNIMRPDKNYKEYREVLRKAAPPCVPFLGVYLTDWTFIGDGNPDLLREKPHQINFHKRSKASELILQIKLNQTTSYNLQQVTPLAKWLQTALFPAQVHQDAESHLYNISLALEPRERDDEKIARLLSESGFL
ncbi:hypothetical protein JCM11641_003174 [Rhodosporidiobolus odoratus]